MSRYKLENVAYCTYKTVSFSLHWNYINVLGLSFDCNDKQIVAWNRLYAAVQLEGASHREGIDYAKMMTPFDTRTLEMVQAGCCPPGLINEILEGGPG